MLSRLGKEYEPVLARLLLLCTQAAAVISLGNIIGPKSRLFELQEQGYVGLTQGREGGKGQASSAAQR